MSAQGAADEPAARLDPELPGPFTVGRYAAALRDFLRKRERVLVIGEVTGFRRARAAAYFELRDADGAVPCSIWTSDLDRLELDEAALAAGAKVVAGGGPDFYPGSGTASPSFSFRVTHLRLAAEGDLLAELRRLRRQLEREGLFEPQRRLHRPAIPRTIGVVAARGSAATADLLAGLERRGWRGTLVWANTPVQDRHAAPRIAAALRELAALEQVEVAVVCRGGGSLFDLWAFCDEALCRTVAALRLPVVSAVGHESDRTLIDDVAAVGCSTPTHAVEELVRVDLPTARAGLTAQARLAARAAEQAPLQRGRRLAELARTPARSIRVERSRLHQMLREVRAAAGRGLRRRGELTERHRLVVGRRVEATRIATAASSRDLAARGRALDAASHRVVRRRAEALAALELAVRAHDPERTLERGYALVTGTGGQPLTSAAAARREGAFTVRFADDAVRARAEESEGEDDERAG